jgi:hypothetical protein
MFQFPPCASYGYFTHHKITGHDSCWVSPFGHLRINAWLAASRSLSWPSPSFFAGMSQGIHLVPWVAYHLQKLIKNVTTLRDFFDSSPILWKPKKSLLSIRTKRCVSSLLSAYCFCLQLYIQLGFRYSCSQLKNLFYIYQQFARPTLHFNMQILHLMFTFTY